MELICSSCLSGKCGPFVGIELPWIFQEPGTALNPVLTIGRQLTEGLELHKGLSHKEALKEAIDLLGLVGIPNPEQRIKDYPYQFSGGMQQRIMIAMAMSCSPDVLIADEPTTALDVTVQAQLLEVLNGLRRQYGTALVIITHNLGVVARYAEKVQVVYAGRLVEGGTAEDIFQRPATPTQSCSGPYRRLICPRTRNWWESRVLLLI